MSAGNGDRNGADLSTVLRSFSVKAGAARPVMESPTRPTPLVTRDKNMCGEARYRVINS